VNPFDAPHHLPPDPKGVVCDRCGSRVVGMCQALDTAALDDMSAESQQFSLPARGTVFREGDAAGRVFTLIKGVARLSRLLPDGKQQVVGFRFAGDLLGYTTRPTYPFDAELLTEARLCRIDRTQLDGMLRRYPVLEHRLLDLCVQELTATQEQLVTVGRRSAESRVAAFLLSLRDSGLRRGQAGAVLDMPMTRADIADFLGLTLETVSRSLTAFRKRGWIREPAHQRVELLNQAAISALAQGLD
jgi:CRP/FNR family transcriptional regulator